MSYKQRVDELIKNRKSQCHFVFDQRILSRESVTYFSSVLKDLKFLKLTLRDLTAEHLKDIVEGLKRNTTVRELFIEYCDMKDEGARYVADALKDSTINRLYIANSNVGDVAAKHLAGGVRESGVDVIELSSGTIGDDGLKTLADVWKDGKIIKLGLYDNKIIMKSSQNLCEMFDFAVNRNIQLNLHSPVGATNCTLDIWKNNSQYPYISVNDVSSSNTAEFINKTFGHVNLPLVNLGNFQDNDITLLKEITNRISIKELYVRFTEINTNILKSILTIFQNCIIDKLELYIPPMFEDEIVLLPFRKDCIKENLFTLSNFLKSSSIRYLSVYMSSPFFNYCINMLANVVKDTQVKHLEIYTIMDAENSTYFADVMEHTQLVSIEFTKDPLANVPSKRYLEALAKNKKTADEICSYFDNLVTMDLEFRYPKNGGPLNQFVKFITLLRKNPNLRTHFKDNRREIEDKIDQFVATIEDCFNTFINNNILTLVHLYENFNFIELVKEFDSENLDHIVENFLLHRQLYYIDDQDEILHPFAYKMLHKHQLPLYDERLEPNKKFDIIKYFTDRPKIEGVYELLKLLEDKCT